MLGTGFYESKKYDFIRSSYSPLVTKEVTKIFSNRQQMNIAEVGAGSGKFTDVILNAGLDIRELSIVEPDIKGIELHKKSFLGRSEFPINYFNTSSDETGILDNSLDAIFVAHAFHWFDIAKTKEEFNRIIKENGSMFIFARFLDDTDPVSAEYISLTRWGKRKNGFINNIEAYSDDIISSFFGHHVEKHNICTEIELFSLDRLLAEAEIRIDSSGDEEIKKNEQIRQGIRNSMEIFFKRNKNSSGLVPLKYNNFYFYSQSRDNLTQ